ncbi:MAG: hypothetical protein CMM26_04955, partial [Rhodospirillaceae bacterium]|nr:hypothetical protein [Rhodospirillaceae bacterium]
MVAKAQSGRGIARGIAGKLAVLPEPVRLFARRRAFELAGAAFIASAAALAVALVSYDSLDKSLNNATGSTPANLLGYTGATIADLGLQSFGIVVILPVLALLAWGTRLVRHTPVPRFGLRVLNLLLAICALAFALHNAPVAPGWPIRAGLGGTFGDLTFPFAASWLAGFGVPTVAPAIAAGLAALLLLFSALGLSRDEWRTVGTGMALGLGNSKLADTNLFLASSPSNLSAVILGVSLPATISSTSAKDKPDTPNEDAYWFTASNISFAV